MVKATFGVLSEADKQLVLEAEPKRLKQLDEDQLIDLHARIRRARNRHTKLYRREAGAQVGADRARGAASKKSRRNAARAEVFEDALARVSRRLGAVAKASADALRAERVAQARAGKGSSGSGKAAGSGKVAGKGRAKTSKASPATKKQRAATKAAGKRRQTKKDAR
ncbi:MAG: hypothetical protein R2746_03945 [Acidimicrobiales bacterium]